MWYSSTVPMYKVRKQVCKHAGVASTKRRRYHDADYLQKSSLISCLYQPLHHAYKILLATLVLTVELDQSHVRHFDLSLYPILVAAKQ